ncbi:uncharacterized protein LOC119283972 [Triticum dicoccoides]|uniref:uncharacterized protein LOC119283972 n=1 Tax=Triticum dicoccoides TaxID=85692 RepID=UPI00188F1FFD|nr:uncharacterized protein LOC119283972 [Triticum dicoccoides]
MRDCCRGVTVTDPLVDSLSLRVSSLSNSPLKVEGDGVQGPAGRSNRLRLLTPGLLVSLKPAAAFLPEIPRCEWIYHGFRTKDSGGSDIHEIHGGHERLQGRCSSCRCSSRDHGRHIGERHEQMQSQAKNKMMIYAHRLVEKLSSSIMLLHALDNVTPRSHVVVSRTVEFLSKTHPWSLNLALSLV